MGSGTGWKVTYPVHTDYQGKALHFWISDLLSSKKQLKVYWGAQLWQILNLLSHYKSKAQIASGQGCEQCPWDCTKCNWKWENNGDKVIERGNACLSLFCVYSFVSLAGTCGGSLGTDNGTFTSTNYPANYTDNAKCTWIIHMLDGQRVMLNFTHFE